MRHAMLWGAASLFAAVPAAAQVTVAKGEEVVLTLAPDGSAAAAAPTAITPDAFEKWAGRTSASGQMDGASGENYRAMSNGELGAPTTPTAPVGTIRLRFTVGEEGHSLLVLANGTERAMKYRATLRKGRSSTPTDVCLVLPGKAGIETWPYPVDAISLSDIRLIAWKPEDGVACE